MTPFLTQKRPKNDPKIDKIDVFIPPIKPEKHGKTQILSKNDPKTPPKTPQKHPKNTPKKGQKTPKKGSKNDQKRVKKWPKSAQLPKNPEKRAEKGRFLRRLWGSADVPAPHSHNDPKQALFAPPKNTPKKGSKKGQKRAKKGPKTPQKPCD